MAFGRLVRRGVMDNREISTHHYFTFLRLKFIVLFFVLGIFSEHSYAINLQQFTRSNTLTFEMLEDARLKNSHVYNDYDFIFTLGWSWVDSPLVIKNILNDEQFDAVIPNMYGIHYGLGMWSSLGCR